MPLPFVDATFAESGEPIRATRMELTRASFQHEVAVLRVPSDYAGRYPTGAPVFTTWGSFPNITESFYGYVHHDEPGIDHDRRPRQRPTTDLVCIGATGVLGEPQSRSWLHTRTDLIARDMASEARLVAAGERSTTVLSNVVQGAESSWKFLVRKVKEEGRVVFGMGTRVILIDRGRSFDELADYAAEVDRGDVTHLRGSVGELNVMDREAVSREGYALGRDGIVAYTDQTRIGDLLDRARPAPRERRIIVGSPAESADALEMGVAHRARRESFLNDIDVTVRGVRSGLAPCSPVVLRGFGSRYDGYWSVDSVKFRVFPRSESTTNLKLVKATVIDERGKPPKKGVHPTSARTREASSPVRLVADRWVA